MVCCPCCWDFISYVYVPYARWVETYHYDTNNVDVHWDEMLGDRNPDVIWNAFDVDMDADTADTIEFENGQQAVIVYDSNMRVEAAWVIADVEDDIELPDAPTGDLITKTLINGTVNSACADTYTTVARAVENATPIRVSFFQAAALNVQLTKDNTETRGAWWAHYASSTEARTADPDTITNGWGGYTTSGSFGTGAVTGTAALTDDAPMDNGNIILVKIETAPLEYVYAAYEIVVTGI